LSDLSELLSSCVVCVVLFRVATDHWSWTVWWGQVWVCGSEQCWSCLFIPSQPRRPRYVYIQ